MKIIDKTPLQNEKGEIELIPRLQGTLKYGFSWYPELQAQKAVITKLERLLERGYVLIRNFTLPNSEIVIPIILIGPGGVYVIYVTQVKGFFEAKEAEWNTVNNGRTQPASINLLSRVVRFSRAFQVYLQRQKIDLRVPIEPVLITADPGAHVEALRPVARVVKSDAINAFAASLLQAQPVLRTDYIHDLADHIVNPRPPGEKPVLRDDKPIASAPESEIPSQTRVDIDASRFAEPINPPDLGFAFEEDLRSGLGVPTGPRETSPSQPLPGIAVAQRGKIFGLSVRQLILLAGLIILEICVLIGFGALVTFGK
jgi:hypothetical protein